MGVTKSLCAVAVASSLPCMLFAWLPGDASKGFTEPQGVIWSAPSGGAEAFDVEMREGAEGSVSFDGAALRISKKNRLGVIVVRPRQGFAVAPGATVRTVADVSVARAEPYRSFGFVRVFGRKETLSPDRKVEKPNFRFGGFRMGLLTCTAADAAERKFAHFKADETSGTNLTCVIAVAGAPSESVWRGWLVEDFAAAQRRWDVEKRRHPGRDFSAGRVDEAALDSVLSGADHTARVVSRGGRPVLEVDGVETPPILYKPCTWPPDGGGSDGKGMSAAGVKLHAMTLRLGSTLVQSNCWSDAGIDVSIVAPRLRKAMRIAPDALYVLSIGIDPPPGFAAANPSEMWRDADGRIVYGSATHAERTLASGASAPAGTWPWVSVHSELWRSRVKEIIAAVVAELKRTGLSRRIVGVHMTGSHDGQFAAAYPDFSRPAVQAFRSMLERKYGTPEALSKAWRRPVASFADVTAPDFGKDALLDPADVERRDYVELLKRGTFRVLEDIVRHTKRCFGKDIVAARWCLGAFSGNYEGAYDIGAFLESDAFDILITQPHYSRRCPGLPLGCRSPLASYRLHGKLFVNEFDFRTYGAMERWAGMEAQLIGESHLADPASWRAANRRAAGMMLAAGMGFWYFDMAAGWFAPDGIRADIAALMRDVRKIPPRGDWRPSAAFVIDEDGALLRNMPALQHFPGVRLALIEQVETLAGAGVPFDVWLAADLIRNPSIAKRYRTLVFSEMLAVDGPRRRLIDELKCDGRALVFLRGCGFITGSDVTGLSHSRPGGSEGRKLFDLPGVPTYCIPGENADGLPRLDRRRFDGWERIYVHDPCGLTPEIFNEIVRGSGGYVTAPAGVQIDTDGRFISVHCLQPGRYRLRMPGPGDPVDMESGTVVPASDGTLTTDLAAGETRWFLLP